MSDFVPDHEPCRGLVMALRRENEAFFEVLASIYKKATATTQIVTAINNQRASTVALLMESLQASIGHNINLANGRPLHEGEIDPEARP